MSENIFKSKFINKSIKLKPIYDKKGLILLIM